MGLGRRLAVLSSDVKNPKPKRDAGNVLEDRVIPAGTMFVQEMMFADNTGEELQNELILVNENYEQEAQIDRSSALWRALAPKLKRAGPSPIRTLFEYNVTAPSSVWDILSRASRAINPSKFEKAVREYVEEMSEDVDADDVIDLDFAKQSE